MSTLRTRARTLEGLFLAAEHTLPRGRLVAAAAAALRVPWEDGIERLLASLPAPLPYDAVAEEDPEPDAAPTAFGADDVERVLDALASGPSDPDPGRRLHAWRLDRAAIAARRRMIERRFLGRPRLYERRGLLSANMGPLRGDPSAARDREIEVTAWFVDALYGLAYTAWYRFEDGREPPLVGTAADPMGALASARHAADTAWALAVLAGDPAFQEAEARAVAAAAAELRAPMGVGAFLRGQRPRR